MIKIIFYYSICYKICPNSYDFCTVCITLSNTIRAAINNPQVRIICIYDLI